MTEYRKRYGYAIPQMVAMAGMSGFMFLIFGVVDREGMAIGLGLACILIALLLQLVEALLKELFERFNAPKN